MTGKQRVAAAFAVFMLGSVGLTGVAAGNESSHSRIDCAGLGLNPGQARILVGAAGRFHTQTPPELANSLGFATVGEGVTTHCVPSVGAP
jgi:hypothetical protein